MKNEISLWDLTDKKVYIKFHISFLENLFNCVIRKVGNQSKLAKLLGKNDSTVYNYYHRNEFISLNIISKILEILPRKERSKWKHLVEKILKKLEKENITKSFKNMNVKIYYLI